MRSLLYPTSDRPWSRAGIDLTSLAGAIVILLHFLFGFDFNQEDRPDPIPENRPVLVDPITGTRSPNPSTVPTL